MDAAARRLALLLTVVVAALAPAAAAHAHSELLAAEPARDAVVAPGGVTVTLTLSHLAADPAPAVVVRDAAGADVAAAAAVAVSADTVCVVTAPLSPGTHTVEYLVTSDDGHRLPGSYRFTVGEGGDAPVPGPCAPAPPPDAATSAATPQQVPQQDSQQAPEPTPVLEPAQPQAAAAPAGGRTGLLSPPVLAVVVAVVGFGVLGAVLALRSLGGR